MSKTIAVCGKGGVGKTTVAALIARSLLKGGVGPVLAVDADPNSNLGPALGIEPKRTVGAVLEEFHGAKLTIPPSLTKATFLELRLHQAVIESKGLDLLVMGRPEGPGCYCSANSILRGLLETLAANYPYAVMDNEAGMEHLSRRTAHRIDALLMITDPSMKGARTVAGLFQLVGQLGLPILHKYVVLCRADGVDGRLRAALAGLPAPLLGEVPEDNNVTEYDLALRSFLELADDSPAVVAVDAMVKKLRADLSA